MLDYQTIIFGIIILTLLKSDLSFMGKDLKINKTQKVILNISGIALIVTPFLTFLIDFFNKTN